MQFTITLILVIITCIVSIGAFSNQKVMDDLIFYPPYVKRKNQWYRMITHGLLHADAAHLIFNMLALYSFGTVLETLFKADCLFGENGKWVYLLLYVSALVVASIPDLIKHHDNYYFRSLGASGAVSAVVFSTILIHPKIGISFFLLPVQIPGYIFAVLYLGISAYLDRRGGSNINHGAHFWGAIYGLVFTAIAINAWGEMNIIDNLRNQFQSSGMAPICFGD